jgi:hypothetical protein
MIIVVHSHPRSGTHFIIDSLRLNLDRAVFPLSVPWNSDFNYGALMRNDPAVNEFIERQLSENSITIFKSHLLPVEIETAIKRSKLSQKCVVLMRRIWKEAKHIYIYRDIRDVMISYYHFKDWGMSFQEFIRSPNDLDKFHIRKVQEYDCDRVSLWVEHVTRWLEFPHAVVIQYEDFDMHFDRLFSDLLSKCGIKDFPPYKRPVKTEGGFWYRYARRVLHRLFGVNIIPETTYYKGNKKLGSWESYYYLANDKDFLMSRASSTLSMLGYTIEESGNTK